MSLRGKITRGALGLVIATSVVFVVWVFMPPAQRAQLAAAILLTPAALRHLQLWKVLTTSFLDPSAFNFILDILMLWMFVPTLERWWGTRRFLGFAAATSIFGHLVGALVGLALGREVASGGLGPFIWASIVAFGVVFAAQPVQLFGVVPIKGRSLAIGAALLMGLMILVNRTWVQGAGVLAAMALALVLTRAGGLSPRLWLLKLRRARVRRQLGVIQGGKQGTPLGNGHSSHPPGKKKDRWVN
jgi:membrane associated rhomboid family serine protease